MTKLHGNYFSVTSHLFPTSKYLVIAFVHIPDHLRKKVDSKSQKMIFVGYSSTSKAYRLWNPVKKEIVISRDVVFDEAFVEC